MLTLCENTDFRAAFPVLHTSLLMVLNETRNGEEAEIPVKAAPASALTPSRTMPATRKIGRAAPTQGEAMLTRPGSFERKIAPRPEAPPEPIAPTPSKKRGPGRPKKPAWKKHADRNNKFQ